MPDVSEETESAVVFFWKGCYFETLTLFVSEIAKLRVNYEISIN